MTHRRYSRNITALVESATLVIARPLSGRQAAAMAYKLARRVDARAAHQENAMIARHRWEPVELGDDDE